jgi:hypothetical protein
VAGGLRLENYPLMRRKDRGIERLDYSTYTMLLGGLGDVPDDVGIHLQKWYLAPRIGTMFRLSENQVMRAGYGRTINPLPWSRPMRGSFPFDISFNQTAEQFMFLGTLAQGIPDVPIPDISSGRVKLPQGIFVRSPNPDDVDRGVIQQWNVAYEYRWPFDIATEFAYVGTRTDGGYADYNLNYGEPGGGNASRKFFSLGGAHQEPLSRAADRHQSAVQQGPPSQGRLHAEQVEEHGGRGRLGRSRLHASDGLRPQLRNRRLRPHARLPDGIRLLAAVAAERRRRRRDGAGWLAGERHLRRVLGHAVLDRRYEQRAELPGVRIHSR